MTEPKKKHRGKKVEKRRIELAPFAHERLPDYEEQRLMAENDRDADWPQMVRDLADQKA